MTPEQIKALPKAAWFSARWCGCNRSPFDYRTRLPFLITWRNANARGFLFGNLMVTIRRPWLEHAARALHPEVFARAEANATVPEMSE